MYSDLRRAVLLLAIGAFSGCGSSDDDDPEDREAALDEFRNAIPSNEVLRAEAPAEAKGDKVDGGKALTPALALAQTRQINGLVAVTLLELRLRVAGPPSAKSEDGSRLVWGPFEPKLEAGYQFVYVERLGAGEKDMGSAELEFAYAMLRSGDEALDESDPLIVVGYSAGGEGKSTGFVFFDLDADRVFDETWDQHFDPSKPHARGACAAVYAKDEPVEGTTDTVSLVATAFRGFAPGDEPGEVPRDLSHFYGTIRGAQDLYWFDFAARGDLDQDGTVEDIEVHMAHAGGAGRADVYLPEGTAVECWDEQQNQTLLVADPAPEADLGACGPVFSSSLVELGIPSLAGTELDELAACVAAGGPGAYCE